MKKIYVFLFSLIFGIISFCQSSEGYDPLIQITKQMAKPNVLIILDITGSMQNEANSETNVGVDSTGFYPGWNLIKTPAKPGPPCPSSQYRFLCTLEKRGNNPSRMAIVKNALGNSVYLTDFLIDNVSDSEWASIPTNSGWSFYGRDSYGRPQWYYCKNNQTAPNTYPFTITDNLPGYIKYPPKNIIGQNADKVNWALVTYSSNYGDCNLATVETTFDLTESGDVSTLLNKFKLNSQGGLGCGGYTTTRGALQFAKEFITRSILGGTLTYYGNKKITNMPRDEKFFSCNRFYGVILVTDGLSNACNEVDSVSTTRNWINPCGAAPYDCDTSQGTYDCDRRGGRNRNFRLYPAGRADELYNLTIADGGKIYRVNPRTWVIGVSQSVNPCELNFTAYMGRTDASAPAGDAGFSIKDDLDRLPHMNTAIDPNTGRVIYTTLIDNEETVSHYNNNDPRYTQQHYAFFANNSEELANAFSSILLGMATGDYTTSAPVASPTSTTTTTEAFLASAEFPSWNGHIYCYDVTGDVSVLKYDCGEKLSSQPDTARKIYTFDSNKNLVEVKAENLSLLRSIASSFNPSFDPNLLTTEVINFIRGVGRSWKLGGVINSTPAIVTPPETYKQNTLDPELKDSHNAFEVAYQNRIPLMYVGADDGLLHCFMVTDQSHLDVPNKDYLKEGYELFAILPPNMFDKQVQLYNNFLNYGIETGQAKQPKDHIYGVASSFRYGDVYMGNGIWKTVGIVTEGPGGDMVFAIDITDPFGNVTWDPPQLPVSVLWYHTSSTLPQLKKSWSILAFGAYTPNTMIGVMGSGYDEVSTTTTPNIIMLDPKDGSVKATISLSPESGATWVRNQAFAHSSMLATQTPKFYDDNIADIGLQPDLHGRVWFVDLISKSLMGSINATNIDGKQQPIYYPVACTGYKVGDKFVDVYTFASGTPFERDSDISGVNVGLNNYFTPSIYIAIKDPWGKGIPNKITRIKIKDLTWKDENGTTKNFGRRTQVTAPPIMIVPDNPSDTNKLTAIYALYDPDTTDCAGTSYVVVLTIDIDNNGNISANHTGYSAGSGAISGFALIGRSIVVAKSGIGEGQRATISKVPNVRPTWNTGLPAPTMWRELQ